MVVYMTTMEYLCMVIQRGDIKTLGTGPSKKKPGTQCSLTTECY